MESNISNQNNPPVQSSTPPQQNIPLIPTQPLRGRWYQSNVGIIVLLIFFFPVGLYLMWRYASWNKKVKWGVTGIVCLMLFASTSSPSRTPTLSSQQTTPLQSSETTKVTETSTAPPTETQGRFNSVLRVIDGDTVQVDIDGKSEVVRLIGEDTPESVDPRKPVQCFANEATKKAKEVLDGKKVTLESDPSQGDKDKYNRLLRYIFLEDGTNFSKLMISEGYAHEYTYRVPYKYMEEFKQAEKEAREAKKGLWADDACQVTATPTIKTSNVTPTTVVVPTVATQDNTSGYSCGPKTKCGEMESCSEAMYYLNTCGKSSLDGDKDGVPCETLCK